MRMAWDKVDNRTGKNLLSWEDFCKQIKALPEGSLWRHNQAGDLPSTKRYGSESINHTQVRQLTRANRRKRGFTYSHKDPFFRNNAKIIAEANRGGFIINLSANSLTQADRYAALKIGPVVATVPSDHPKVSYTPEGRKCVVCPKQTMATLTCLDCKWCARENREVIIVFRAHGTKVRKLDIKLKVLA